MAFWSEIEEDKYGNPQKNFFLTQGDTMYLESTPTNKGVLVDFSDISKCVLNILNSEYKIIFSQEFVNDTDRFVVKVSTEDTTAFPLGKLRYEVEYTFVDGTVATPNQGLLTVLNQGTK